MEDIRKKLIRVTDEDSKLSRLIKKRAKNIPLEEVRKATAGIKGNMSDLIRQMRDEE